MIRRNRLARDVGEVWNWRNRHAPAADSASRRRPLRIRQRPGVPRLAPDRPVPCIGAAGGAGRLDVHSEDQLWSQRLLRVRRAHPTELQLRPRDTDLRRGLQQRRARPWTNGAGPDARQQAGTRAQEARQEATQDPAAVRRVEAQAEHRYGEGSICILPRAPRRPGRPKSRRVGVRPAQHDGTHFAL